MTAAAPISVPGRLLPVHALIFGGASGALGAWWSWMEHAFGFYGGVSFVVAMVFPILAVVLGVQRWRDGAGGGAITFPRAFGAALAIGLVYSAIVGAFAGLQLAGLQPEVWDTLVAFQNAAMADAGQTPEEIAVAEAGLRENLTPRDYAMAVLTRGLLISFVVGLLASAFLRRTAR